MSNPADQLASLLADLPRASDLRGFTKDQLRSRAAELGISTAGIETKRDLIQALTDRAEALQLLEGVRTRWVVVSETWTRAFIEWREVPLLVDLDLTETRMRAVDAADEADELGRTLQQAGGDLQEVDGQAISLDELLELLDRHASGTAIEVYLVGHGLVFPNESEGGVVWLPEDAPHDYPKVIVSHWDFLGPGDPSPASDNPGTVYVSSYRGLLLGRDLAAEVQHIVRLPDERLSASSLLGSLAGFYQHLVGPQTYSLELPEGFDDADVSDFLEPAGGVGVLRVDGEWWYETPTGWTEEHLPPIEPQLLGVETIRGISLHWAYGGWSAGPLDMLLVPEGEGGVRVPLGLLAGHKVNGWHREDVALATVHLHDGTDVRGLALRDDGTVSRLIGVQPTLRVDPQGKQTWIRNAAGDWNNFDVPLADSPPEAGEIFWAAIEWLRQPGTGEFVDQAGTPRPPEPEPIATVPDLPSLNAPPPFQLARELDTGSERFVMLHAVGRDADGFLWIDPNARARRAGLPTEDPVVILANNGIMHVDVSELERPVPPRSDRHARRAIEGRPARSQS